MLNMLDSEHGEQEESSLVYRSSKHNSLINCIQFILSFDLLLRLLSCKLLLLSDCLHCLKTPTNLFNSITLSNTFVGSTSVTSTHPLGPRRVGPGLRCKPDPRVGFRWVNAKNLS